MTAGFAKRPAFLAALLAVAGAGLALGQEVDDIFAFVPPGGRTLLEQAIEEGLPEALGTAVAQESGDADSWRAKLEAAGEQSAAIAGLDSWQTDTLAQYLAANAPLEAGAELPPDGRDMSLQLCQSCHIITVVVTQSRTREAWLGTLHKPSHIVVDMSEAERGALADYLVINGGIPIDQVPPALRAGGASY